MSFSFAFLVLDEHPYGRAMLAELLAGGFVPDLMIVEASDVAEIEREKFLVRMAGFPIAASFEILAADIPQAKVTSHNDDRCAELLRKTTPDLIVLGGTRILKPRIFEAARHGTINAHPGLLPEVRGSASVAWAIHRDEKVGCTTHFVERDIDTGPIVNRREIPVHRGDTYEKLCHATVELSAVLMREALEAFRDGTLARTPQGEGVPAHRNMPDDQVEEVKKKLAEGRYTHLV